MPHRVLYAHPLSANCHRVRLALSWLSLPYVESFVDLASGAQRAPEHLARDPLGKVPVLVDGEHTIQQSHLIAAYLARRYDERGPLLGAAPEDEARIARWAFFDVEWLHPGIGRARNQVRFGIPVDLDAALRRASRALAVLEAHLSTRTWLELERPTLAELSCFPLVDVVEEASLDLASYPHVAGWRARVRELPGFVEMVGRAK